MTRTEIIAGLNRMDVSINEYTGSDLFAAFCRYLAARQMGHIEMAEEWYVYREGWIACANYQAKVSAELVAKSIRP